MSLGAEQSDIFRLVIATGMRAIFAGLGLGIAGAFATARLIASMLVGVTASDPATLVVVAVLISLTALAACWIPAHGAARVDPLVALKYE